MPRNLSDAEVAEFRERLCRVAERRFAAHGVDGVTMRQLAQELGCSATTPYRYFRDKDEILAAVRAAAFDRFATALEAAAETGGRSGAKARAVGDAYIRFAFAEPDAYRLMFDLSQPGDARFPEVARASARARRTMQAYIEALVRDGVLHGDPRLLGYVFWAGMHGLVVLHLAGKLPPAPDFRTLHAAMMQLLTEGSRAAAAQRPRLVAVTRRRRASR